MRFLFVRPNDLTIGRCQRQKEGATVQPLENNVSTCSGFKSLQVCLYIYAGRATLQFSSQKNNVKHLFQLKVTNFKSLQECLYIYDGRATLQFSSQKNNVKHLFQLKVTNFKSLQVCLYIYIYRYLQIYSLYSLKSIQLTD